MHPDSTKPIVIPHIERTRDRDYRAVPGSVAIVLGLIALGLAGYAISFFFQFDRMDRMYIDVTGRKLLSISVLFLVIVISILNVHEIKPREALVLTMFGKYRGTLRESGIWWLNPFMSVQKIPLATTVIETKAITVNDLLGNPISIGAMIAWRVEDAASAHFDVTDYRNFAHLQADAALRHIASQHPYDATEVETAEKIARDVGSVAPPPEEARHVTALRSNREEINKELIQELNERTAIAGIVIDEVRITHLAYAPEIAAAMLKRQQAGAIVAARAVLVEGALGIIKDTIASLEKASADGTKIEMDDERKVQFAQNLLVMIIGDSAATPVMNVGTLHG